MIIDDEKELVQLLQDELTAHGHEVLTACDGIAGAELAARQPDLILLDIMMPGMDGFEVCRAIQDEVACPILFLSARQSEVDRVRGLSIGGDDYIVKPFGLRELLARIDANLRREKRVRTVGADGSRSWLQFGKLGIDIKGRAVRIDASPIELTRLEYDIVELLALHRGQVFSREQIYEKIWGYDAVGDSSTVVDHVKKIRAKFSEADPESEYISTVWGIGYKWNRGWEPPC